MSAKRWSLRAKAVVAVALIGVGLSACSDSEMLYRPLAFGTGPIDAAWAYGFAGRVAVVEVHNAPSSTTPDAIAAAVPAPVGAAPVQAFTADPSKAFDARYRVVLVFQAPIGIAGNLACAGNAGAKEAALLAPDPTSREVQAALCRGDERLSEIRYRPAASGVMPGAGSPESERAWLRLVMEQLYTPPVGGSDRGDSCRNATAC